MGAAKQIHQLDNEAMSFDSDDMIAIDSVASDTRKMSASTLITITSQNAIAGNLAKSFREEESYTVGKVVAYEGKCYKFKNPHHGPWNPNDVDPFIFEESTATDVIPDNVIEDLFDDF